MEKENKQKVSEYIMTMVENFAYALRNERFNSKKSAS
jgi:hypothetical protein